MDFPRHNLLKKRKIVEKEEIISKLHVKLLFPQSIKTKLNYTFCGDVEKVIQTVTQSGVRRTEEKCIQTREGFCSKQVQIPLAWLDELSESRCISGTRFQRLFSKGLHLKHRRLNL